MSTPEEIKLYVDRFGSEDARMLATVVINFTFPMSMARHDGMEALKRLADTELETYVVHQIVSRGYSISLGPDRVKVTLLNDQFFYSDGLATALHDLAMTFCGPVDPENPITKTDIWPLELRDMVRLYLESQGLPIEQPATKIDPAVVRKGEGSA